MKRTVFVFHSGQGNSVYLARHVSICAQSPSGTAANQIHADDLLPPELHQSVPYQQTEEVL